MPSSEPHVAFANRFVESRKNHPDLMEVPWHYREDVMPAIKSFIIDSRISSEKDLRSKSDDIKSRIFKLAIEIERKQREYDSLVLDMGSKRAWTLRTEIFNDLKLRFEALKLLRSWIYD